MRGRPIADGSGLQADIGNNWRFVIPIATPPPTAVGTLPGGEINIAAIGLGATDPADQSVLMNLLTMGAIHPEACFYFHLSVSLRVSEGIRGE